MSDNITIVRCPTCGKEVKWTNDNAFRPFCSVRCKLIDLGTWAAEGYAIKSEDRQPGTDGNYWQTH